MAVCFIVDVTKRQPTVQIGQYKNHSAHFFLWSTLKLISFPIFSITYNKRNITAVRVRSHFPQKTDYQYLIPISSYKFAPPTVWRLKCSNKSYLKIEENNKCPWIKKTHKCIPCINFESIV